MRPRKTAGQDLIRETSQLSEKVLSMNRIVGTTARRGLFAPPPWSPGKWPDQLLSIFCSTLRKSRPRLILSTVEFDRTWSHTVGREMIRRLDLNPLEGSRQIEMDHTPIAAGRGPVACADSGRHGGIGSAAPNRVGRLRVLSGFPDDRARRATARGRA